MSLSRTSTQHVLIFGETVFEEGLAHLLKIGTNLRVSDARYTDDIGLLDHIARKRPDAIVLNESTPLNTARILKLLFSIPSLDGLRIIIMRLANNRIDVYAMPKKIFSNRVCKVQQFTVTRRDELFAIVQGQGVWVES